jgi:hypothetical protein
MIYGDGGARFRFRVAPPQESMIPTLGAQSSRRRSRASGNCRWMYIAAPVPEVARKRQIGRK